MTETILKIKSIFDPKGADEARSSFKKLKAELGGLNGIGSKANGIFSNFFGSLTRIAKLRLLRGIIRSITSAFKEGTQNLYEYSRALGAADASHFANTMDSLASSMLYMKNSIGAIVAPLLTSLLPAIQTVVNWFVTATQVVAQFFAALGGQVMYTRAKQYATAWKDVGTATGGAAAAAKEYKNTIMSFDEIHALNDTPSSGGGGGGGASAPDYSDMFEEAAISSKIRALTEWIRDNFKDILEIVTAIGAVMLGWKIADSVAGFMTALGFSNGAAIRELGLGITLVITGVTLATKGGFDIGYEGVDLMNVIKTALGIGLAGAGGAMAAQALTSLGIASVGTGVGAVFGIGIALVGTIIGFTLGEGKKQREEIIAGLEDYAGEFNAILNSQNTFISASEQAWDEYAAKISNLELARSITDQLADFQSQTEYTSGEIEHIKTLIDELNGLGLDGIRAEWDEATQTIQINTDEIYNNINALEEEYRKIAYKDIYIAALRDEANRKIELKKANNLVEKAQSNYNEALKQYQPIADAMGISLEELAEAYGFEDTMLADEAYALRSATDLRDKAIDKLDEATGAVNDVKQALGYETTAVVNAGNKNETSADKIKTSISNAAKSAVPNLDDIKNSANNASGAIDNVKRSANTLSGTGLNTSAITNGINATANAAYSAWYWVTSLNDMVSTLRRAASTGINIAVNVLKTLGHANGGFVTGYEDGGLVIPRFDNGGLHSAQLFMANENGQSELIGNIGNRTAVANQSQMIDMVSEGVYRAVSEAMNSGNSNVEVIVNMDSETVARAADKGNRSLNRRFSVSLA